MGHLNLEAVPVGVNGIEIDCFQHLTPEAFESAGGVGEWHAGNPSHVQACSAA